MRAILNFIFVLLSVVTPCLAHATVDPGERLSLDLLLTGESYHSEQEKSLFMGPTLDVISRHPFDEGVESRVDVAVELFTGSATGILPPDLLGQNGPRQNLRLREALINVDWLDQMIELQAGALNQRRLSNPLLTGDIAFMGASQEFTGSTFLGNLGLLFEEAVPPSSFSLLETAERESTPGFYLAQISDAFGNEQSSHFKIFAGYFEFQNLSTAQARQSLFYGNTVTGNASSAAFFLPYRGFEGGAKADFRFTPTWGCLISANAIRNIAAPGGSAYGYIGKVQLSYFGRTGSYSPEIGYFYDQSDSSPGVFSDAFLSSKNHRGTVLGFVYKNDVKKYSVFGRWMRSEQLVPQLYTSDQSTLFLGMEIPYEIF